MILFQHVSKTFTKNSTAKSSVLALDQISCKIEKGEFVFLTGHSGAGKSTLLRMLFLDIRPDHKVGGQLRISFGPKMAYDSKETRDNHLPFIRRHIGVVFQDFRLLPHKNVFENIAFPMQILGFSTSEIQQRVWEVMTLTGIHNKRHLLPEALSGGEQQRVAIARAIVNSPKLLVADEPTGNLDPENAQNIFEIFKKINAQGTTIVMATHDPSLYNTLYGRRIKMENGKMINREWI